MNEERLEGILKFHQDKLGTPYARPDLIEILEAILEQPPSFRCALCKKKLHVIGARNTRVLKNGLDFIAHEACYEALTKAS